jgi:hypothetical protein
MTHHRLLFLSLCFLPLCLFSQQKISAVVTDFETRQPIPHVTIMSQKSGTMKTDSAGKFSFRASKDRIAADTITFSVVGYGKLVLPLADLAGTKNVLMKQEAQTLGNVMVFASLKGDYRRFGYYRSWNVKNEGGEIGYVFWMPRTKIQVGQVQVKVNHNYDTCWLKLHLRDVPLSGLTLPENDLLKKEVVLATTTRYGLVEFDLDWEPVSLPNNQLYVGFELLKCGCSTSTAPSFFFMGNEEGENFYRDAEQSIWKRSTEYTIYIKMFSK